MLRMVYMTKEEFEIQNSFLKTNLPHSEDTAVLGEEYKIGNKTVLNRLACQAMEGCDGTFDGRPDELTRRRYRRFAEGGAGIIWFEATAVLEEGRANPRQLYINENTLDSFKKQVNDIKETALKAGGYEPLVIMQATHSGRYSKPQNTAFLKPAFQ